MPTVFSCTVLYAFLPEVLEGMNERYEDDPKILLLLLCQYAQQCLPQNVCSAARRRRNRVGKRSRQSSIEFRRPPYSWADNNCRGPAIQRPSSRYAHKYYNSILCATKRNFFGWNSVATCSCTSKKSWTGFQARFSAKLPALPSSLTDWLIALDLCTSTWRHVEEDVIAMQSWIGRIIIQLCILYCYHLSVPLLIFTIYSRLCVCDRQWRSPQKFPRIKTLQSA